MAQFNEQDHPRDEGGQFTSKGNGSTTSSNVQPQKKGMSKLSKDKLRPYLNTFIKSNASYLNDKPIGELRGKIREADEQQGGFFGISKLDDEMLDQALNEMLGKIREKDEKGKFFIDHSDDWQMKGAKELFGKLPEKYTPLPLGVPKPPQMLPQQFEEFCEDAKEYYVKDEKDQRAWDKLSKNEKWLLKLSHRNDETEDYWQEIDQNDTAINDRIAKKIEEVQYKIPSYQENEKKIAEKQFGMKFVDSK